MLTLGAVAYDPKVVTIWEGFRSWLDERDFDLDFVLYSAYDQQVSAFMAGHVDIAWNSPLAWVRCRRLSEGTSAEIHPMVMRDTDRDLRTVVIARADSEVEALADPRGRSVAVGAADSPQAALLPLSLIRSAGVEPHRDVKVVHHDIGVGLHGDHIGGERAAAEALRDGLVDAACITDSNLLLFSKEGTLAPDGVRVVTTTPTYDHCIMAATSSANPGDVADLTDLLLGMSYADPSARTLMDLEGLKAWLPARTSHYADLERAVDEESFYGD